MLGNKFLTKDIRAVLIECVCQYRTAVFFGGTILDAYKHMIIPVGRAEDGSLCSVLGEAREVGLNRAECAAIDTALDFEGAIDAAVDDEIARLKGLGLEVVDDLLSIGTVGKKVAAGEGGPGRRRTEKEEKYV